MLVASPSMVFSRRSGGSPGRRQGARLFAGLQRVDGASQPSPDGEKSLVCVPLRSHSPRMDDGASVDDEDYTRAARDLVKQLAGTSVPRRSTGR